MKIPLSSVQITGRVDSVTFRKGQFEAEVEIRQSYLDEGYRSLGTVRLVLDNDTAQALISNGVDGHELTFTTEDQINDGDEQESET